MYIQRYITHCISLHSYIINTATHCISLHRTATHGTTACCFVLQCFVISTYHLLHTSLSKANCEAPPCPPATIILLSKDTHPMSLRPGHGAAAVTYRDTESRICVSHRDFQMRTEKGVDVSAHRVALNELPQSTTNCVLQVDRHSRLFCSTVSAGYPALPPATPCCKTT